VCFQHGDELLLCRLLPGRIQQEQGANELLDGYDSFPYQPGEEGKFLNHCVRSADQVLPYCVYHFKKKITQVRISIAASITYHPHSFPIATLLRSTNAVSS